ncbi:UDP-galactose transporter [Gautieria morchelliformis]|nr:UDP-galactose transporter [Gautieria morchelliformis]
MAILRLAVCVGGVYSMFLIWAIAQERLSVPFPATDGSEPAKFKSALFMGMCQSALSALSSLTYIYFRSKPGQTFRQVLGLESGDAGANGHASTNGHPSQINGSAKPDSTYPSRTRALTWAYFQTSLLITTAAPFGFAALSHISYPTMVLGKSCKLVPVLIMNVLLYRRRFALHKYLVVAMVTAGISIFMFFGADAASSASKHATKGSSAGGSNLIGLLYLFINLALDGAINSTQDEIFSRYKVTGQQMMFFINIFGALISAVLAFLPLPYIPVLHPSHTRESEMAGAIRFIDLHPGVVKPLAQFALTGSLGQLFIFETLQHFGSLTLVMITLTRKMFTMILSVVVYNHALTAGQWVGAGTVFAGIGVEAWVKRRDVHSKRVIQEREKARTKQL